MICSNCAWNYPADVPFMLVGYTHMCLICATEIVDIMPDWDDDMPESLKAFFHMTQDYRAKHPEKGPTIQ